MKKITINKLKRILIISIFVIFVLLSSVFIFYRSKIFIQKAKENSKLVTESFENVFKEVKKEITKKIMPQPKQLPTPEKVKGIYINGYIFLNDDLRNKLIKLVEDTELNSVIIDIQDPIGKFTFEPKNEFLQQIDKNSKALSYEKYSTILNDLQNKNIYTIARIITFQDNQIATTLPNLALKDIYGKNWKNWNGVSWLDMTNQQTWKIPVQKALEAKALGFDEIQFDYIRFPSDGNIKTIKYANFSNNQQKADILKNFYKYLFTELKNIKIPISIDLYGFTYKKWKNNYALGIGQRLADAAPYFDYICPMLYPSHYPNGYLGFDNPALFPYETINNALKQGQEILANLASTTIPEINVKTRPWLQDFDIGANYEAPLIRAQIKACDDNNASGWMLWNALNKYTVDALLDNNE